MLRYHMSLHGANSNFEAFQKKIHRTGELQEDGTIKYFCDYENCDKSFSSSSKLNKHHNISHALVPLLTPLGKSFKTRRSPLISGHSFTLRELLPRNLAHSKFEAEQKWIFEWLTARMGQVVKNHAARGSYVYIVGVLGPKYHQGLDVLTFIKENPDQLSLYFGRSSGASSPDINPYHRILDSPLFQPDPTCPGRFLEVVLFGRKFVEGTFEERTNLFRQIEARYIELALNDAEFEPAPGIPQYKILNQRRERHEMMDLPDGKIRKEIKHSVRGVTFLCLKEECDDPKCFAYIHPDWKADLKVDMSKRRRSAEEEDDSTEEQMEVDEPEPGTGDEMETSDSDNDDWIDSQPEPGAVTVKLPRPMNPQDIEVEVDRRFKEFKEKVASFDPSHTVYTVITTDNNDFDPSKSAPEICKQVITRQKEDLHIGDYTGVNSTEKEAEYHSNNPRSSLNTSINNNRTGIRIATQNFATRVLARKAEALRLLHSFLHMRFRANGINFDIINQRMEWQWLALCSEEEIKRCIRLAWLGIPPVVFEELSEDCKFEHGEYPVNLCRQVLVGKVEKIDVN
ncbi:uncharacterized protein LOC118439119 isoform X2 [Folsomia candida]|nr:uncharacterized protein LOC118439119 isoform X2 [Folsomia candida]